MVKQPTHNRSSLGSIPSWPTSLCPVSSMDRIRVFETQDGGSIPSQGAKFCKCQQEKVTLYCILRRYFIVEGDGFDSHLGT